MAGMSRKEIAQLVDHLEPQGVTATRTTKGILLRFPDQSSAMVHFTGSDHRERLNVRARVKRAGLDWPGDHSPLPSSVTDHRPNPSTIARVKPLLQAWDAQNITGAQLRRLWAAEHPDGPALNVVTASRALYHLGWKPHGKSTARKWLRPFDEIPEPEWLPITEAAPAPAEPTEPAVEPEGHPVVQLHPDAPPSAPTEPTEPTEPRGREFIDTAESWTADTLPDTLTLAELRAVLTGLGLQWELRVWRA